MRCLPLAIGLLVCLARAGAGALPPQAPVLLTPGRPLVLLSAEAPPRPPRRWSARAVAADPGGRATAWRSRRLSGCAP